MKGSVRLVTAADIPRLSEGLPDTAITRSVRVQTTEEFAKQSASVARRRTNASVVGIVLLEQERIALVKRTGSNSGWALPSGSLRPRSWLHEEPFRHGIRREMHEELGVDLRQDSINLEELEERTFIHAETGAEQRVYVATYAARVAVGQEIRQTRTATREGLTVQAFDLSDIPELAFNDNVKIEHALEHIAI